MLMFLSLIAARSHAADGGHIEYSQENMVQMLCAVALWEWIICSPTEANWLRFASGIDDLHLSRTKTRLFLSIWQLYRQRSNIFVSVACLIRVAIFSIYQKAISSSRIKAPISAKHTSSIIFDGV
ncbi:MAG: hypothetical protein WAW75_01040 [Gallionella sp.]|jgi:hypothetical protein